MSGLFVVKISNFYYGLKVDGEFECKEEENEINYTSRIEAN